MSTLLEQIIDLAVGIGAERKSITDREDALTYIASKMSKVTMTSDDPSIEPTINIYRRALREQLLNQQLMGIRIPDLHLTMENDYAVRDHPDECVDTFFKYILAYEIDPWITYYPHGGKASINWNLSTNALEIHAVKNVMIEEETHSLKL